MSKRQNTILNMMILVLALCVTFFAFTPVRGYADDSEYGSELDWGYANADKGVKWTQYQDGDEYTLVLELTETGQASSDDSVKAIRRLLDKNASGFVRDTLGKNTTKIVIKEGITGIGWKTIRNDANEPKYGSGYNIDDSSNTETDVFNSFNKLKEVVPCSTIKRIGWSAFRKCNNLESFDFAACTDLEEIMNQAFNPSGLKEADLSGCKKLKTIRCSAFNDISNLKSVTLPENLENVGKTAFGGCSNLETLTIKENSEPKLIIWENAFSGIAIKSLTIPKSVIRLRRYAFEKCVNLETATFADTSITELWQYAFSGDTKLDEVIDEATKKLAFTKPAAKDLFTNYSVNLNAFQNTALLDSRVDLEAEVDDKKSDYSGSPQNGYGLTDEGHVNVTGLADEDELTGEGYTPASGTTVGTYTNGSFDADSFKVKRGEYITTDNYNVDDDAVNPGDLTIDPASLTVKVKDQSYTYNGEAQGENNATYTDAADINAKVTVTGLKGEDKLTGIKLNGCETNANVYEGKITASEAAVGDATGNYTISYEAGKLTIKQADLTITMADRTLPYSGQTQYGWARTDAGKETVTGLVHNETVTITYSASSGKTAGTYTNGAYTESSLQIKDGDTDVTENYNLTSATAGKLTIEKDEKELKVESASKDWDYDAGTHTYKVYTVTYGTKKIVGTEGQTVFTLSTGDKVTVTPTGKGASGVKNVSDSGANSFTWTVENEGSYTKGTDKVGTLTINKAPLTITTPSGTKVYDGTPITRPNGTVTGLVNGETATVTGTGSQTAVGSSQNGYKIVWGSAKEANYEIVSENLGTLTVTAAPGGGGNDGNAAAPATGGGTITPGTPEGEAIDDEPVPAADTPEEPQVIDDPDVPLADNGGWALVNLLCMLGTAGLFAAMLARSIRKRQEGERAGIIYVIAGLAVAVFSALIFFMTEDMKLPMIMTDKWTLLMAVILAVQLAVTLIFRVRTADEDEEE